MPKVTQEQAEERRKAIPKEYFNAIRELNKERTDKNKKLGRYPNDTEAFNLIGQKLNMAYSRIRFYVEDYADITGDAEWQGYLLKYKELNKSTVA